MKPNDKAYAAAIAEGNRWDGSDFTGWRVLREDDIQNGWDIIAEFDNREERDEALERLRAEAMVNAAYAAQFPPSEDYAGLIERLRLRAGIYKDTTDDRDAADALESVLAERDELKAELAAGHMWIQMRATVFEELAMVRAERDALLARLAPVEAIENDKDDPTREYIPLPGGWEIQTKGRGSSYRLLDKKTGERHMILAGDAPFVQEFVTRMAKEINASAQVRPVAPVDDEALVEIAARAEYERDGDFEWATEKPVFKNFYVSRARAVITAIRPHIEAAERERCAKALEITSDEIRLHAGEMTAQEMRSVLAVLAWKAAAIRSGK